MDIGAKIVEPDFSGPVLFAGGFVIEKDHIGFDALFVENTDLNKINTFQT